jgi:hypothetical protein
MEFDWKDTISSCVSPIDVSIPRMPSQRTGHSSPFSAYLMTALTVTIILLLLNIQLTRYFELQDEYMVIQESCRVKLVSQDLETKGVLFLDLGEGKIRQIT